jgi:gliding motility-associated-like protein
MKPPVKRNSSFLSLLLCFLVLFHTTAGAQSPACSPFLRQKDTIVCSGTSLTLALFPPPAADSVLPGVWKLLISGSALDSVLFNIKPFGYDRVNQYVYSIIHQKILRYDLKNRTVGSVTAGNWPGDYTEFVYDPTNNRLLCWKAGRDNVYAIPATGGNWALVSTGITDRDCFGASDFWNPITKQPGIYGGYGFNRVKSWIFENNASGWQQKRADPPIDTIPKGGNLVAANSDGTKLYVFSGQGNYTGDELTGTCTLGSPWATPGGMYCWLKDLWELDLTDYSFKNILPVNDTSIKYEGAVSYDYDKSRFFLFGGFQPTADAVKNQSLPNTGKTFRFRLGKEPGFREFIGEGDVPAAAPVPGTNGTAYYDPVGKRMIWARFDGIWAYYPDSTSVPPGLISYNWSTGDTSASISIKPVQTTLYKVTRIAGGRTCADSVTITIPNMKTALQATVNICGDSTVLDAGNGFQAYTWNTGATTKAITVKQNGTYLVNVTIGGCTAKDSSKVQFAKPVTDFTIRNQKDTICVGDNDSLSIVAPQSTTIYSWYLPGTSTPLFTGAVYPVQNITKTTDYIVNATSNPPACLTKGAITRVVTRIKLTKPIIRVDSLGTAAAIFSWDPVAGASHYNLSIDKGNTYTDIPGSSTALQKTVTGLKPNQQLNLILFAMLNYACETSDSSRLTVTTPNPFGNGIYVPNAFTPNGDGANDVLLVYGTAIASIRLMIFNQWGNEVFVSTDITKGWDGRYKNGNAAAGVYTYALEAIMQDGTRITKTGSLTLVR